MSALSSEVVVPVDSHTGHCVDLTLGVGGDAVIHADVARIQGHDLGPAGDHQRLRTAAHLDGDTLKRGDLILSKCLRFCIFLLSLTWSSLGNEIVSPLAETNFHVMTGAGYPLASQSRVRLAPRGP